MTDQQPLEQLRQIRIEKLEQIQKLGINPYPATIKRDHNILQAREMMDQMVAIAGRIRSIRGHGNLYFLDLEDPNGKIQTMLRKDLVSDTIFTLVKLLDIGDFVSIQGKVITSKTGETTVEASNLQIVTKSLRPLPDSWYGLKDVEERYRHRYIDMILNPEVREKIINRSKVVQKIREFLLQEGFLEVETPILEITASGALANPFLTHIKAYDMDLYLRICMGELWQKKLMVAGFEKTFEIGRAFRNEGVDREHNPEFTMMEYYYGYADYLKNMEMQERLMGFVVKEVTGDYKVKIDDQEINFQPPYSRKTFAQLIKEATNIDIDSFTDLKTMQKGMTDYGLKIDPKWGRGHLVDEFYKEYVRPNLIQPVFVTHHPRDLKPLAKADPNNPEYTQSFQLLANGFELSNNYSELNDPIDQAERFAKQSELDQAGDDETMTRDSEFVEALEYGMPPVSGTGIGIDRFVALITNSHHIREVIAFPLMKPKTSQFVIRQTKPSDQNYYPIIKDNPYFRISDSIKEKYPSVSVGLAIVRGVKIVKNNEQLSKQIEKELEMYAGLSRQQIGDFKEIASYRQMYHEMGVDWHSRMPSPEALLKRIIEGKGLYNINVCVDAYNLIVMRHRVSCGAFDLSKFDFPTELTIGLGGEKIDLLGKDGITDIKQSEVFYQDKSGPYNLDFNYRDAVRTAVTESTKDILINVDGVYDVTRSHVERTLKETLEIITKYCGGEIELAGIVIAK